jgi:hypothetical protein
MTAPYLTRGLLLAALYLASHATALASPCGDASRNFNRIANSNDNWYVAAFERATGLPVSTTVNLEYCPRLLPLYRERLRRQRAVLQAYRAMQRACVKLHEESGFGREGLKLVPAPVVMQSITTQVQLCEQALTKSHVHFDAGARTCTNQLGRCVSYRRAYGPMGSEPVCTRVFRTCMTSGVWDATAAFPYGGARITDMIRR